MVRDILQILILRKDDPGYKVGADKNSAVCDGYDCRWGVTGYRFGRPL